MRTPRVTKVDGGPQGLGQLCAERRQSLASRQHFAARHNHTVVSRCPRKTAPGGPCPQGAHQPELAEADGDGAPGGAGGAAGGGLALLGGPWGPRHSPPGAEGLQAARPMVRYAILPAGRGRGPVTGGYRWRPQQCPWPRVPEGASGRVVVPSSSPASSTGTGPRRPVALLAARMVTVMKGG